MCLACAVSGIHAVTNHEASLHCTQLSACQANGCVDESYAPRVLLFSNSTGWPDHERVSLGPSARQDACSLPQLQVSNSGHGTSSNASQQQLLLHPAFSLCLLALQGILAHLCIILLCFQTTCALLVCFTLCEQC